MQGPHDRDDHDPARLSRALLVALAALVAAAPATAGRFAALPSPAAALSASPPLGGGASASAEGVRHRVAARTDVAVSVDGTGRPFRVVATQRLDVRVAGDYFFTIGAPVVAVSAARGSQSSPGFRIGSLVWAGFDPGHRVLAARATLDARQAAPSLPLRVTVAHGRTVLTNTTAVASQAFTADAERAPLLAYLARLRSSVAHGALPVGGSATVLSTPAPSTVHVIAPLRVRGTIGGRAVSLLLRGRPAIVPATGAVDLTVTPVVAVDDTRVARLGGRALLAYAMRATLTVARARQYDAFLGNPDPTGPSETTYRYRTGERAAVPASHPVVRHERTWLTSLAVALGSVLALGAALVVWARS